MADPAADERWMREALLEAEAAAAAGDVPVGAVIVGANGELVARGRNERELAQDPTGHAEIAALRRAAAALGHWRLEGATVYVTLEPCPMCAGAIIHARLQWVVFGAFDPRAGAGGTVFNLLQAEPLNHKVDITAGLAEAICGELLWDFFRRRRD